MLSRGILHYVLIEKRCGAKRCGVCGCSVVCLEASGVWRDGVACLRDSVTRNGFHTRRKLTATGDLPEYSLCIIFPSDADEDEG